MYVPLRLNPSLLERAIRYAIDHWNTLAALKESERQLRYLSGKLLEAQENERRAIAQELHDSIGASLTAIRYGLEERLQREDKGGAPDQGVSLEQIIGIVQDTTEEVHRISSNLRPSILDDMGLFTAIRSICRELQNVRDGIRIKTQISVKEHEIPESLSIIIYRILQEALNNAFKHSGADTVYVSLKKTALFLELRIKDNGKGFDNSEQPKQRRRKHAMGLIGMKDRAELSSGTFEVLSEKGKGTTVLATWKLGGAFPVF
jgi:signal transduction histidine kinase